jgi:hypothetical protein
MKPEIPVLVAFEDDFGGFGNRYITSSSIVIFLIISLFIDLFNVFLITFIIRKEYGIKRRQIGFWE